jgi:serine protease SohB
LEYIYEYGLFLAQAVTFVAALLILVAGLVALAQKQKTELHEGHIEVRNLNDKYRQIGEMLRHTVSRPEALKALKKTEKKAEKLRARAEKKRRDKRDKSDADQRRRHLYVLAFHGDLKASATDNLREEISAVLPQVQAGDEILVKVESPGGLVHGYGLAASQLKRITDAQVPLTIAVDKVAASGGYMMACVANRIIAAPFAVLGSIGVLAQLPNFNRLLKKHDIDFEFLTAGEYKRTLSIFGENTEKGRQKFMQELEETHALFKSFVSANRPALDISRVATGEVWYGQNALEVGLVDELQTSDAFVQDRLADWDVFEVRFLHRKSWQEKLGLAAESALEKTFLRIWQRSQQRGSW